MGLVEDEQNGYRKSRSCQDHLSSLATIIDNRKLVGKSTYVDFIDFSKAYDRIKRHKLWSRLNRMGVPETFLSALKSLYQNVECTVKINGNLTDWFPVNIGLKQGCMLSPSLFNLYINGLIKEIKASGIGVDVDMEKVVILVYADDIVILPENEHDLQKLLDIINRWSQEWQMMVNVQKSKIVHFRKGPSIPVTEATFQYREQQIQVVDRYRYLGLIFTEYLDFSIMAKYVSQAAQRVLGMLIAKSKAHGGMPYAVFTKLFDSLVQPIIDYGASIWDHKIHSSIQAVQNRAVHFFLGVGRKTLLAGFQGDMGWKMSEHRSWLSVVWQWCRLANMDYERVNRMAFVWSERLARSGRRNVHRKMMIYFEEIGLNHLSNIYQIGQYGEIKTDFDLDLSSINIRGTRRLVVLLEVMELAGTN